MRKAVKRVARSVAPTMTSIVITIGMGLALNHFGPDLVQAPVIGEAVSQLCKAVNATCGTEPAPVIPAPSQQAYVPPVEQPVTPPTATAAVVAAPKTEPLTRPQRESQLPAEDLQPEQPPADNLISP